MLNSKYTREVYEQNVKEGGRAFPQVKLEKLKPLPIVIPTPEERKMVENFVNQITSLKEKNETVDKIIKELDNMIDKMYRR